MPIPRFSSAGVILGALAYVMALTPSLIPRDGLLQGLTAGLAFAAAYGLLAGFAMLYRWLGLREVGAETAGKYRRWALAIAALIIVYGLFRATGWQNAVRQAMELAPVESARPWLIAAVSLPLALVLILLGKLFCRTAAAAGVFLARLLPARLAGLLGFFAAAVLFWSIGDGVFLDRSLKIMDNIYARVDANIPAGVSAPQDPLVSGGPQSLAPWESLGNQGRERVTALPAADDLAAFSNGGTAAQPIRVYVGLNSADDPEARARLALAELQRTGAFERPLLVIATPTGTGWVDPAAMAPMELLHRGNIASVSVQYSYLPSWLTLFVNPEYGVETARAVFREIYNHWRTLPRDKRPRLYLFGLSLGALNSQLSTDLFDVIADPYQGALWAGPPFASTMWREVTDQRQPESPAWLPRFRDGTLIRFANQKHPATESSGPWGPIRIVYLQYASDGIVFFDPATAWRSPAWMAEPRGPDVSPAFRWIPVVTFLQLGVDAMTATTTPAGVGHVYDGSHYLDAWIAVTQPEGWSEPEIAKLRGWLKEHQL